MGCCNGKESDKAPPKKFFAPEEVPAKTLHPRNMSRTARYDEPRNAMSSSRANQNGRSLQSAEVRTLPQNFRSLYSVGDTLGEGTFAVVKKCVNRQTGQLHAVKIIDRSHLTPETESSLRGEATILKKLNHNGIVKLIDFFEEERFFYMVEELVEGGELFDRIIQKHNYNEREARDLVRTIFQTIKYCHDNDVVHRDLKPENLLLANKNSDTEVKLADFGFATVAKNQTLVKGCGTLDYVAPEILKHDHYGKPVDIWSAGVVTYILLGGHPPFFGDSDQIEMEKIKHGNYEFDKEHWQNVSKDAKDFISHLLQINPGKRYTAEQALNHHWITKHESELESISLDQSLHLMKTRHHTLKSVVNTVMCINRLKHLANEHHQDGLDKWAKDELNAEMNQTKIHLVEATEGMDSNMGLGHLRKQNSKNTFSSNDISDAAAPVRKQNSRLDVVSNDNSAPNSGGIAPIRKQNSRLDVVSNDNSAPNSGGIAPIRKQNSRLDVVSNEISGGIAPIRKQNSKISLSSNDISGGIAPIRKQNSRPEIDDHSRIGETVVPLRPQDLQKAAPSKRGSLDGKHHGSFFD